jgi:hypothetical protein
MKKVLLFLSAALCASSMAFGQAHHTGGITDTFIFTTGNDGFYRLEGNNAAELQRLYAYVDQHSATIKNGETPVHVHGYNTGLATQTANLNMAKIHSNRVKSELIVNKGLREGNFRTENTATAYEGHKSAVVIRIGAAKQVVEQPKEYPHKGVIESLEKTQKAEAERLAALNNKVNTLENRVAAVEAEEQLTEAMVVEMIKTYTAKEMKPAWKEPYSFALRTNLAYWAGLLPNLGIEWRTAKWLGIKIDGAYSNWKFKDNRRHKMWLLNPEIRFYLGQERRIYLGVGGNFGKADMSWRAFSKLYNADHGYNGNFWNAGLVLGYQARLTKKLSLDLNLGFGRSHFKYDIYRVNPDVDTEVALNQTKTLWGLTQAGVTVVWRLGRNK